MKEDNLIEKLEKQTGQRIDSNNGENNTMAMLFGHLAMALSKAPNFTERDSLAVGIVVKDKIENGQRKDEEAGFLKDMLLAGISPDDINNLLK